ncbi:MAG: hypothetical protein M3238_03530 [Actinomycetota bacterium]|nr:hypothetical protein [Actinomycetota bacterium]
MEPRLDEMRRFIHDMRNPLGALSGFVHLLKHQRDELSDEQFHSVIDGIDRSARKLSELLESFAAQRKADSG